eukprot:GEMP01061340.1.p1 GENE.GEMP01061340.1~~GEMP01061340.1.p1  ORF type:complete len:332 (+),score=74.28 GEMP01061340.1:86-1081(+)
MFPFVLLLAAEAALLRRKNAADQPDPYHGPFVYSYESAAKDQVKGLTLKGKDGSWQFKFNEPAKWDAAQWAWVPDPEAKKDATPSVEAIKEEPPADKDPKCSELSKLAKIDFRDTFIKCNPFSFYSNGVMDVAPWGCTCTSWSVNCPFETCDGSRAWNDCLDDKVKALGFKEYSKNTMYLAGNSVSHHSFLHHPGNGALSSCIYLRTKPANPALEPLNVTFAFPVTAEITLDGPTLADCAEFMKTPENYLKTQKAFEDSLNAKVSVLYMLCGSFKATIEGAPKEVDKAVKVAHEDAYCFTVDGHTFCKTPAPAPAPAPGPAPAPAPAPASA